MSTFDSLKETWKENYSSTDVKTVIDEASIKKIIKSRTKKQINAPIYYFWGQLALQIMLYAILCHIIIRFWLESNIVIPGVIGILLYLPFTIMLLSKFRKLAAIQPVMQSDTSASLKDFVSRQIETINAFFVFKKSYELFLVPVSTAIGVYLFFAIYFSGGILKYWDAALVTFLVTMFTTVFTLVAENRKRFRKPLNELQAIINDFNADALP